MSKLDRISTFVAVANSLGFAAAARNLHISTAAVSQQIALLEKELGVSLFERSTRRVSLTEVGQNYYLDCQRIIGDLESADAMAKQSHDEPAGRLRVTSERHFAEHYIVPRLSGWMKTFPKVELDLELAERIPDLQKERIDILIGMSMPGPLDCIQKQIGKTRYVFCASPAYLKDAPKSHRYIAHTMRPREPNMPKPILTLNDTQAMLQCAKDGIGIVKLHDYVVQEAVKHGELTEIVELNFSDTLPIFACYQAQRFVQPKIRQFIDYFSPN